MKKHFLILALLLSVVLTNCKKDKLIEINGIVSGKIVDAASNTGVQGVKISFQGLPLTDSTAADGSYTIGGIPAGEYIMIFSKEGYAITKDTITISNSGAASSNGSSSEYRIVNHEISILPLIGKAKGRVYGESNAPLALVLVTATVSGLDSAFTTTTDAYGYFSYSNLPFKPNYNNTNVSNTAKNGVTITVVNGNASGSNFDTYAETAAAKTLTYTILVNSSPLTFLGGNYQNANSNSGFDPNAPNGIILYFSENISSSLTLQKGNIQLLKGTSVIGISISGNTNKLVITPNVSLEAGKTYTITGIVYASESKYCIIPGGQNFQTSLSSTAIANPLKTSIAPVLALDASKNISVASRTDVVLYEVYVAIPGINNGEFVLTSTAPFNTNSTTDSNDLKTIKGWDGSSASTSTYTVSNTQFYVVPVGLDSIGKTARGLKSNIVVK
jgi:hypothetical protein